MNRRLPRTRQGEFIAGMVYGIGMGLVATLCFFGAIAVAAISR